MRYRLTRLVPSRAISSSAHLLAALLLLLQATPSLGQTLRFVETKPVASRAVDGDKAHQAILSLGDKLRHEQRWHELTEHYQRGLKTYPTSEEIRLRFETARAREDVERRYADASYRDSVRQLSDREAIDLYSELLAKVQSHYVDTPDWQGLVDRGLLFAQEALNASRVQQLSNAERQAFVRLHAELDRYLQNRVIANVQDAREAAWFAGQLAKQRTAIPASTLMLEFVAGATAALDTYSSFLTPDQLDEVFSQIEGNFVGLGIELDTEPAALKIVNVIPGGPAALAGVKTGDHFVALDGKSVAELGGDVAANMLRGEEGSSILVDLARGNATLRMKIVRRVVEVPSVVDVKIVDQQHQVGYFKLASFQKSTSRDVDNALWQLHKQGMRSLVIDLRGNPGGLLDAAVQVADKFIHHGAIVSTRGRTERFEFTAHQEGTWNVPLVVLIDGDSASASEILAGALRDHRRAQVVGTKSYGKGSVQGIFPLSIGKAGVRLTTAKFYSPSGRAISKNGVLPTKQIQTTAKVSLNELGKPEKDFVLSSAVQTAMGQSVQPHASRQRVGLTTAAQSPKYGS